MVNRSLRTLSLPIVSLLMLLMATQAAIAAVTETLVRGHESSLVLDDVGGYLHDATGELRFPEIRARRDGWAQSPHALTSHGFATGAHWRYLSLRNVDHSLDNWLLVIDYALLDRIDVFTVDPRGRVNEIRTGDQRLFAARSVSFRHPNVAINLPRGERIDVYIRVETESSVQIPLRLYSDDAFLARVYKEQIALGLYFGLLTGLLLYNLLIFLTLRDPTYLWYVLYVTFFGAVQLGLTGLAFEYLWPRQPVWANLSLLLSMTLGQMAMLQFSRSVLELRERFAAGDRVVLALIGALAVLTLLTPILSYRVVVLMATASVLIVAPVILVTALHVLRAGFTPARYFLLAWSFLLVGVVVYALLSFGLVPKHFLTEHGIQIGSAAELTLLAVVLAYRIRRLTEHNRDLVRESTARLESRVRERTADLDKALADLGQAHQALQAFSQRDGLTGVHNRRYADTTLQQLHAEAIAAGKPLSVLMVDIDHFKSVNDRLGHLRGDDCLRAVARTIQNQLQIGGGFVARYGGEEFISAVPGVDSESAREYAESVRKAVAQMASAEDTENPVTVTVSIGCATLVTTQFCSVDQLIERADRALYSAKSAGRNRVVSDEETAG